MLRKKIFNLGQFFVLASTLLFSGGFVSAETGSEGSLKLSCEEARFTKLLNLYRQSKGLRKVVVSKTGVVAARWHSQDMINKNYFSHTEPNGRRFFTRAQSFGFPARSENIAAGNRDAEKTFCQWKNSPGHDANMQGPHKSMGIGQVVGGGRYGFYWSNSFAGDVTDAFTEPLTTERGCILPIRLPPC